MRTIEKYLKIMIEMPYRNFYFLGVIRKNTTRATTIIRISASILFSPLSAIMPDKGVRHQTGIKKPR